MATLPNDPTVLPGYRPPAPAPDPAATGGDMRSKFREAVMGGNANALGAMSPANARGMMDRVRALAGPEGPKRLGSIGDLRGIAAKSRAAAPTGSATKQSWWDKFDIDHKASADKSYADYKKLMGD